MPGAKPKLALADRVLVCLEYWREYRTYFHIGSSWGVSEATVYRIVRWVEDHLMQCGQFRLAGKKQLVRGFGIPQVVVMDVTETPIERPKRRQRAFYSGKKRRHTLKCQIVLELESGLIVCTFFGKGRRHDFKLYQALGVRFAATTESLQRYWVSRHPEVALQQSAATQKAARGATEADPKGRESRFSTAASGD
jgi:hypothetical protein